MMEKQQYLTEGRGNIGAGVRGLGATADPRDGAGLFARVQAADALCRPQEYAHIADEAFWQRVYVLCSSGKGVSYRWDSADLT
jgi:hypothetical protein